MIISKLTRVQWKNLSDLLSTELLLTENYFYPALNSYNLIAKNFSG